MVRRLRSSTWPRAARRWVGRRPHFLRTATAERVVSGLPGERMATRAVERRRWRRRRSLLARLSSASPAADDWPLVLAAARRGGPWCSCRPSTGPLPGPAPRPGRCRRGPPASTSGLPLPQRGSRWARGRRHGPLYPRRRPRAGRARRGVPGGGLRATACLDVAAERARRDGAACVSTSAAPSLAAPRSAGRVLRPGRPSEPGGPSSTSSTGDVTTRCCRATGARLPSPACSTVVVEWWRS